MNDNVRDFLFWLGFVGAILTSLIGIYLLSAHLIWLGLMVWNNLTSAH